MSVVAHFCCLSFGIMHVLVFGPFLDLDFISFSVCAFIHVFSYRLRIWSAHLLMLVLSHLDCMCVVLGAHNTVRRLSFVLLKCE